MISWMAAQLSLHYLLNTLFFTHGLELSAYIPTITWSISSFAILVHWSVWFHHCHILFISQMGFIVYFQIWMCMPHLTAILSQITFRIIYLQCASLVSPNPIKILIVNSLYWFPRTLCFPFLTCNRTFPYMSAIKKKGVGYWMECTEMIQGSPLRKVVPEKVTQYPHFSNTSGS